MINGLGVMQQENCAELWRLCGHGWVCEQVAKVNDAERSRNRGPRRGAKERTHKSLDGVG